MKRVNWAGGSSKFVGELGTVDCVSGSRNLASLKPLCGLNESLSYNVGLENSTCVVDMCFCVPNLGGSVSVIVATRAQPGARRATYSESEMPSKRSLGTGTQPVRYRANVLLPARWCCDRNPACL